MCHYGVMTAVYILLLMYGTSVTAVFIVHILGTALRASAVHTHWASAIAGFAACVIVLRTIKL